MRPELTGPSPSDAMPAVTEQNKAKASECAKGEHHLMQETRGKKEAGQHQEG